MIENFKSLFLSRWRQVEEWVRRHEGRAGERERWIDARDGGMDF